MDALNMEIKGNSFDMVIDKGTLDALSCGENYQRASRLLSEMLRVCGVNGTVWIITNSPVPNRIHLFENNFEPEDIKIYVFKQFLSESVNLINIMRNVGEGKSIKQVMMDEKLMKKVTLKCKK